MDEHIIPRPSRKDLGDFQTPPGLVGAVLRAIGALDGRFRRVFEPCCGLGHFISRIIDQPNPPEEICGIEWQADYAEAAKRLERDPSRTRLTIHRADCFAVDFANDLDWQSSGRMLVVGNPPWVTSSAIGASSTSGRLRGPDRRNEARRPGLVAMTGASNFDMAEAVWVKLFRELGDQEPTMAILCKSSVARAVLRRAGVERWPIRTATIRGVDACRWFGVAVDAVLLHLEFSKADEIATEAAVFADLEATQPSATLGFARGDLLADPSSHGRSSFADGRSPFVWRQGIKHDASKVMELSFEPDGSLKNGFGERVDVESDHVFPLYKSSDLAGRSEGRSGRALIVTQRRLAEDTTGLASTAPRLWSYLEKHAEHLAARKSSIYRNRPPFSQFGVGGYSFRPWKVAISGLYKKRRFRLIGPDRPGGPPPMVDDTCYYVSFDSVDQAALVASILESPEAEDLLRGLVFLDAMRPVTKGVLQRVDLRAIFDRTDHAAMGHRAARHLAGLAPLPDGGESMAWDRWESIFDDVPGDSLNRS